MGGADTGLQLAIAAAGGKRAWLARGLKVSKVAVQHWTQVPQDRVFEVAQLTGIAPDRLRPDLADWIVAELTRRELATALGSDSLNAFGQAVADRWDGPAIEEGMVDLWASLAAVHFVARARGLKPPQLYAGQKRFEEAARAYAMALAKVVGRARSTHIAGVFQCSRQNVDNATERYLRARDGDDPDDYITGQFPDQAPRVFEAGSNRLRRAKDAQDGLWDAETQFAAFLSGDVGQLPQPERKRA